MGEPKSEIKITKQIGEITFGGGFCKCCQRQIHWCRVIYINVGEMCFIPMNIHIELFNGVRYCVPQLGITSDGTTIRLFTDVGCRM